MSPPGTEAEAGPVTRVGDICSRTFLFLTTFRNQISSLQIGAAEAEAALQAVWREEERASESYPELYERYRQARYLLVVCADELMGNLNWDDAPRWRSQENLQFGTTIGGERFFELMDDPAYGHPDLREIFFQCLALGFQGRHQGEANLLRDMRRTLRHGLDELPRERSEHLSPGAYEETLGEDFTSMPVASTARLIIVLLGVVLTLALLARVAYSSSIKDVAETAAEIANSAER
ncbi:MAG: DotU family type IV/VI secretion system protein [Planctomycetota bacterium]